jgi:integrase
LAAQAPSGISANFVFPSRRGGPICLRVMTGRTLHPVQVPAGIVAADRKSPKCTGFYSPRHFYASWSINRKADGGLELPIKVMQGRLGHASIKMTADVYGHLFSHGDDAAKLRRRREGVRDKPASPMITTILPRLKMLPDHPEII